MRGESVHCLLDRLRLADGAPLALEAGSYPLGRLPGLLDEPLDGSLYDLLGTRYDARPDAGVQRVTAARAGVRVGRVLQIPPAAALLIFERRTAARGRPIELVTSWYRADRYALNMELTAHPFGRTT